MKGALIKLQGIASDDFLKRHTLKKASGNKLAKMKRVEPLPIDEEQDPPAE